MPPGKPQGLDLSKLVPQLLPGVDVVDWGIDKPLNEFLGVPHRQCCAVIFQHLGPHHFISLRCELPIDFLCPVSEG